MRRKYRNPLDRYSPKLSSMLTIVPAVSTVVDANGAHVPIDEKI